MATAIGYLQPFQRNSRAAP